MDEFFEKPIIEQMYSSRREEYEQSIMDSNDETRKTEGKLLEQEEIINKFLSKFIKSNEDMMNYNKLIQKYDSYWLDIQEFWNKQYYKQGMIDFYKLMIEIGVIADKNGNKTTNKKKELDDFLNYSSDDVVNYIYSDEEFKGKEMKELQTQYKAIGEKYPRILEVYEDNKPIQLTKEEIEQLIKLHNIDVDMQTLEMRIAFKKGIHEMM